MTAYLDASVAVSAVLRDANSKRALAAVAGLHDRPLLSTWTQAEFASAVRGLTRKGQLPEMALPSVFKAFDAWCRRTLVTSVLDSDVLDAAEFLRDRDTSLRTPDALHLAICRRLGAELLTFDQGMIAAARSLGVSIAAV